MKIFEDFYPLNDEVALVVTGKYFFKLSEIRMVIYKLDDENKVIILNSHPLVKGKYLRLGNIHGDRLHYSDEGIYDGETREQPFMTDKGLLYTKDFRIWLNDALLIDKWEPYNFICNPSVYSKWVYFEALKNKEEAPNYWEVWRYNMDTKEKEIVLKQAANPYVYKGHLYYSRWNDDAFHTFKKVEGETNV